VSVLQENLTFDCPEVFNFEYGLVYHNGHIYLRRDSSNPFSSFLEPFDDIRTIWGEQHIHLDRLGPVKQLGPSPMWLQVVHGANVSNRIRGERILRADWLRDFAIRERAEINERHWEILMDQIAWYPYRVGRDSLIRAYKYFRTLYRGDGQL
jgi:hypothetical protein